MKKILILLISAIMLLTGCGKAVEPTKQVEAKQEVKQKEKADFSTLALNKDNVQKVAIDTIGDNSVKNITVKDGNIIIEVFNEPEDEKNFVINSSMEFINFINETFKNNNVKSIEYTVNSTFSNKTAKAIYYKISKDKYSKIDWNNIKAELFTKPTTVFDSVDSAIINPSILSKLK